MAKNTRKEEQDNGAGFGLSFDLSGREEVAWIDGSHEVFANNDEHHVRARFGGKPFRIKIRRLLTTKLDEFRRRHTPAPTRKVPNPLPDLFKTTRDAFAWCVLAWEGIGGRQGAGALPCDDETKARLATKEWEFANAVVDAAVKLDVGCSEGEAAEIESFR